MIRTRNLPGKYSDEEIQTLKDRAAKYDDLSDYIRAQLKLPKIPKGAPKGNRNAIKSK